MQRLKYSAIILVHVLLVVQGAPVSTSSNTGPAASPRNPEEIGGHHQGDIVLQPSATGRGVGAIASYNRWANGVVPYEFAPNISVNNSIFIVNMMRQMETLTAVNNTRCISFREKNSTDPYFITIYNGSGCFAPVGSWGNTVGLRPVSLMDSPSATCMISGTIQHELTHVLGFFHEQSRPDRDAYVSIQWSNIQPSSQFNFDKYNYSRVDTQMTSYDYGSVMHYGSTAFAINGSAPTIIPILNSSATLGQRIQLSPIDILEIQRYYGCVPMPPNPNATTSTTTTTGTTVTTSRTTTTTATTATSATTTQTTTTSATTTSATTATTTSATTATTTSATTTTATTTTSGTTTTDTTTTTTSAGSSIRHLLQSQLRMYLLSLISMMYLYNQVH